MISIRHKEYELRENPELAFTRLEWAVETVDNFESQLISNLTIETSRPWVGVLEKDILRFRIIEPRGLFSFNFFQIVVRGKFYQIEEGSMLQIKIRLGIYTLLTFILIYLVTLFFIYDLLTTTESITVTREMIWFVFFPTLGTFLLNMKVNNVDKKVRELFGVTENHI